jgi:gluconolactonase
MNDELKILATGLQFPEGPVVLEDGSVVFVEIAAGRVSRCWPDGKVEVVATPGGGPNGAALGTDGLLYVCNNGGMQWHSDPDGGQYPHGRASNYECGRIERVDFRTGRVERLYDRSDKGPLLSPNDIVFDAHGGFWFTDFGSMGATGFEPGRVCYAKADGAMIKEVVFPMLTPNGIGLSPDGMRLYVAETVTARLWSFEVCAPGELALQGWPAPTPGEMLYASPTYCMFDSLALEQNGNICIATIGAPGTAGITVIDSAGKLVERVPMPDRSTTNICFGGPDKRDGYITQSRSGRLVQRRWSRPGLGLRE